MHNLLCTCIYHVMNAMPNKMQQSPPQVKNKNKNRTKGEREKGRKGEREKGREEGSGQ